MLKAYKYRIYPNKAQREIIDYTLTLCQKLYNAGLEHRVLAYKKRSVSINYYTQANELKGLKQVMPEYNLIHSQVLQEVLKRLDKAYQNFFRRVRTGDTPGFPRFQSYKRYNSFTYPQSGFTLTDNILHLSKIGKIRVKLHRLTEGVFKTCTIIRKNGKYYTCLVCEVEPTPIHLTYQNVGIDMGIKEFCITSNGEFLPNPKNYRRSESKLKQQQGAVSRKRRGSNRRKKAIKLLAKTHEHVSNQRKDNAFKLAYYLLNKYDTIVREDLQIKNMVKNHKLAKSISDAGWGLFFNILEAKAKQTLGKQIIAVNPRYTSQICSSCSQIVKKDLSVRIHKCNCGLEIDRDINAARNILRTGLTA